MALPAATAPIGGASSAFGLTITWAYLLWAALTLSNAISRAQVADAEPISILSLIQKSLGPIIATSAGVAFILLITSTMVAQLSKLGTLIRVPMGGRAASTILYSLGVYLLTLSNSERTIERLNDTLTIGMVVSFIAVVTLSARPSSGFVAARLSRTNYKALLPSRGDSTWAIPVFLQLLLYSEVVPSAANRLRDQEKTRNAILYGSLVPASMCLIWTLVALGLVPWDEAAIATGRAGEIYDPLSHLVRTCSGRGTSSLNLLLAAVNSLTFCASTTTVIGSILASSLFFESMLSLFRRGYEGPSKRQNLDCKEAAPAKYITTASATNASKTIIPYPQIKRNSLLMSIIAWIRLHRRPISKFLGIAPAACIAAFGSKELYYGATVFAGQYPTVYLYGLLPALANLSLELKEGLRGYRVLSSAALALVSVALLIASFLTNSF